MYGGENALPDLSLAIMMAPGNTPSLTACSNFSSKDGVMIAVSFDVGRRLPRGLILCLMVDRNVHGYVVLIWLGRRLPGDRTEARQGWGLGLAKVSLHVI